MKGAIKLLTSIIAFLQLTSAISQNVDTVFVKRTVGENAFEVDTLFIPGGRIETQVLAGTTFLPSSDKIIGLLNHGLSPIRLEILQECEDGIDPKSFEAYPKFVNLSRDSNVLTVDVAIIANCCHNFLGEAEVTGNDTLNLVYTSYGGFCSCRCCFTLRYTFDTSMEEHYQILNFVTINESITVAELPKKE